MAQTSQALRAVPTGRILAVPQAATSDLIKSIPPLRAHRRADRGHSCLVGVVVGNDRADGVDDRVGDGLIAADVVVALILKVLRILSCLRGGLLYVLLA